MGHSILNKHHITKKLEPVVLDSHIGEKIERGDFKIPIKTLVEFRNMPARTDESGYFTPSESDMRSVLPRN